MDPWDRYNRTAVVAAAVVAMLAVGLISYLVARQSLAQTDTVSSSTTTTTMAAPSTTQAVPTSISDTVPATTTSTQPPRRDFADLFVDYGAAVGSIDVITCDSARQGTGFLYANDVVITAASLVDGAAEIAATFGEQSTQATVLGLDAESGVAALRLTVPLEESSPIAVADQPSRVGHQVGAITNPAGLPQTLIVGRVSSIAPQTSPRQVRTDADVALGSGGGVLLDDRGQVVGVVAPIEGERTEGPLAAASIPQVADTISTWIDSDTTSDGAFCVGSVGLDDIDAIAPTLIASDVDHPEVAALQRTFAVYSQSINSSRAEQAFGVLGPAITQNNTAAAWAEGQQTSKLWDWRIRSVDGTSGGLRVRSVFTSTQDAEFGFDQASTCTRWDITHDLVRGQLRGRDYWLIDRSRATEGRGPVDCDDWSPEVVRLGELTLGDTGGQVASTSLAAGTVNEWRVMVGLTDALDPEAVVEQNPLTLTVTLSDVGDGFDPVIEVFNGSTAPVAAASGSDVRSLDVELDGNATVDVQVRDAENRNGGPFSVSFVVSPTEADPDE